MQCNCCSCQQQRYSITPHSYYKKKCECYVMELEAKTGTRLWSMQTMCDGTARELYSHIVGRKSNITCLIQTYEQADELFDIFKTFANVWSYRMTNA